MKKFQHFACLILILIITSCSINKGKSQGFIYTVKKGDNLHQIAKKYNTSVKDIKYYNDKYYNDLAIGETLFIPSTKKIAVKDSASQSPAKTYPTQKDDYGLYYTVVKKDNLFRISKNFGLSLTELKEMNNLAVDNIDVGQKLYVKVFEPKSIQKERHKRTSSTYAQNSKGSIANFPKKWQNEFILPVEGRVSSPFGQRNGRLHKGVDITAPPGTSIKATYSGTISYSGFLSDYGNVIIIEHGLEIVSVYAHNEINLVKKSDKVKKGDIIAKVGSTGRSSGPHLHFELRISNKPVDPAKIVSEIDKLKRL